MGRLENIARNAWRPHYLPVMARKAWLRVREGNRESSRAREWALSHRADLGEHMRAVDRDLWDEAEEFNRRATKASRDLLDGLDDLGVQLGGGNSGFLYFLARHLRPATVVETGVGAGHSTRALLRALQANGRGELHSSDFPYFRIADPERYVGILVDDDLKARWSLHLDGDRRNLDRILPQLRHPIGLAHYDSDKSRAGRDFFMRWVSPHLAEGAVVVMDDIDDNLFFADYVEGEGVPFHVFPRGGVHMGVLGLAASG